MHLHLWRVLLSTINVIFYIILMEMEINPHTGSVILVWVLKMLFLWNYPILSVKTEEIPFLILGPAAVWCYEEMFSTTFAHFLLSRDLFGYKWLYSNKKATSWRFYTMSECDTLKYSNNELLQITIIYCQALVQVRVQALVPTGPQVELKFPQKWKKKDLDLRLTLKSKSHGTPTTSPPPQPTQTF